MECNSWKEWLRAARSGQIVPLDACSFVAKLQLVFASALAAALLDTVAAWLGWSSPVLRQQAADINATVAQRMGAAPPPAAMEFSALGVFSSSLFVGTLGGLIIWGIAAAVVTAGVFRIPVRLSSIGTAAVLPIPLTSLLGVLVTVAQLLAGSVRVVPSLGALLDPASADIRVFAVASRVDLGALLHAVVMMRLVLHSERWSTIGLGALVAFVVRAALVVGGILLVASATGLQPS
jgi:hypothetical protein